MASTTINNINTALAHEVSDEIASLVVLFAQAEEKDKLRRLALRDKCARPAKVAPIVRDARRLGACVKKFSKDAGKKMLSL